MSMSVVVKKFGGTSVANIERIEFVADKIFQFYQQKQRVIVVVSAMKGETDKLESLAYQISDDPDPREMAALLSTGEQVVISLLAMALIKRGCPACSYTGLQLGIETDGMATKSKIKCINTQNIYQDLEASKVVIVAGFQGVDINNGNITTLGRGGSDTTAVALSIALNAKQCDIYTDVDGVYTADPNIVPSAKRLNEIKFHEMLELSGLGAKEAIIGSLYSFYYTNDQEIFGVLCARFGDYKSAFAYLLFILLSFPCVSVVASISKELGKCWAVFSIIWTTWLAYFVSICYYQLTTFNQHPIYSMGLLLSMCCIFMILLFGIRFRMISLNLQEKLQKTTLIPLVINNE